MLISNSIQLIGFGGKGDGQITLQPQVYMYYYMMQVASIQFGRLKRNEHPQVLKEHLEAALDLQTLHDNNAQYEARRVHVMDGEIELHQRIHFEVIRDNHSAESESQSDKLASDIASRLRRAIEENGTTLIPVHTIDELVREHWKSMKLSFRSILSLWLHIHLTNAHTYVLNRS